MYAATMVNIVKALFSRHPEKEETYIGHVADFLLFIEEELEVAI